MQRTTGTMAMMISAKPSPIARAKQVNHLNAILKSLRADRSFWLKQAPDKKRNRALKRIEASIWETETLLSTM